MFSWLGQTLNTVVDEVARLTGADGCSRGNGSGLPEYLSRPAPVEAEQPGLMEDARVYCFGFEGQLKAIDATADRYLNAGAEDGLVYRAVSPVVLATFMDAKKLTSTVAPFGWLPDRELALWTLLAATTVRGGQRRIERLVWWMPWVWVDTAIAMMTGRGVWGFEKSMGSFEMPRAPQDPATWVANTRTFKTIDPTTEGLVEPLFTVQREDAGVLGDLESIWHDSTAAIGAFAGIVHEAGGGVGHPTLGEAIDLAYHLLHLEVPLVNLKQFRDVADGSKACFQTLVESPAMIRRVHGGGLMPGRYSANILPRASQPLVEELGLAFDQPDVRFAAWVDMDFSAGDGREVWRAGEGLLRR